jgi:CIC family chloride channel protein
MNPLSDRVPKIREEFGAILIGLASGLISVALHHTIDLAEGLRESLAEKAPDAGWIVQAGIVLGCGLLAAAAVAVVARFAPEAEGSGIATVIAANENEGPIRALRIICVKFLGGFLVMAAGMPLGREGPSVQIGAMSGVLVKNRLPTWLYKTRAIRLGAVGGLAAAFNAPLTAVLFSFEMLHQPFTRRNCYEAILVAATADWLARMLEGPRLELPVTHSGLPGLPMLAPVIGVGLVTGVVALAFQKTLLSFHSLFERSTVRHRDAAVAVTFALGCVLGLILIERPELLGVGHRLFDSALTDRMGLGLALTALGARIVLTAASYATGAPGGLIVPAILLGVLSGQAFSAASLAFVGAASPDYHAVCVVAGMAASLGALFRIPLTAVLLTVEITGTFDLVLEIAVASVTAQTLLARAGQPDLYAALARAHARHAKADQKQEKDHAVETTA